MGSCPPKPQVADGKDRLLTLGQTTDTGLVSRTSSGSVISFILAQ